MHKVRIPITAGFFLLLLLIAGCNRPVPGSKLPSSTPLPSTAEPLSLTRTSLAGQIMATLTAAGITPNQPQTTAPVETAPIETASLSGTGPVAPSSTAPAVTIAATSPEPSATPTIHSVAQATLAPSAPAASVPQMVSVYPQVYTLHRGEFPWCLARRFDVNPRQLLAVNGFHVRQIFYTGQQVYFPNHPMPFPGRRALRPHPASYRVAPGDTIYSIACFFGDVDPIILAEINGISSPYRLTAGQVLSIP